MIGQYQAVYNQFIRNNHWEMNQERYTHTSFSKGPATSTYTNTKKRLGESDTDTEQFPKMFNVELLLTSKQAQCKPEMDGSQRSEKNTMEQFQKKPQTNEKKNNKRSREVQ